MKLGLDIYSVRSQGWDAFQHLDYAAHLGLDVVHFSELKPFEQQDDGYLREVRAHADQLGLSLEAGMGSICPTSSAFDATLGRADEQLRHMLHAAVLLGSPILRCLLGGIAERYSELPLRGHIDAMLAVCRAVRAECLDLGVKLAIENHAGDLQAHELVAFIEEAGPEFVGACVDPGNAIWAMEDPCTHLQMLAPYVLASHGRDSHVMAHTRGAAFQWVPFGDGNVGIDCWVRQYQALCPGKALTLEIITGRAPTVLPYLEPEHWHGFGDMPAWQFARFEALVRASTPYLRAMVTVDRNQVVPEYQQALIVQQRLDVERSVKYCQETLGIN